MFPFLCCCLLSGCHKVSTFLPLISRLLWRHPPSSYPAAPPVAVGLPGGAGECGCLPYHLEELFIAVFSPYWPKQRTVPSLISGVGHLWLLSDFPHYLPSNFFLAKVKSFWLCCYPESREQLKDALSAFLKFVFVCVHVCARTCGKAGSQPRALSTLFLRHHLPRSVITTVLHLTWFFFHRL